MQGNKKKWPIKKEKNARQQQETCSSFQLSRPSWSPMIGRKQELLCFQSDKWHLTIGLKRLKHITFLSEKKHYLNLNGDWKLTLMQNLLHQQTSNSLPPVSGVVTMIIMFLSPSPETHQNCQGQNMNAATSWLHLEKKNYQNTICQTNYTSQTTAPTHFSSFLARRPCRLVSSLLRKVLQSQWEVGELN